MHEKIRFKYFVFHLSILTSGLFAFIQCKPKPIDSALEATAAFDYEHASIQMQKVTTADLIIKSKAVFDKKGQVEEQLYDLSKKSEYRNVRWYASAIYVDTMRFHYIENWQKDAETEFFDAVKPYKLQGGAQARYCHSLLSCSAFIQILPSFAETIPIPVLQIYDDVYKDVDAVIEDSGLKKMVFFKLKSVKMLAEFQKAFDASTGIGRGRLPRLDEGSRAKIAGDLAALQAELKAVFTDSGFSLNAQGVADLATQSNDELKKSKLFPKLAETQKIDDAAMVDVKQFGQAAVDAALETSDQNNMLSLYLERLRQKDPRPWLSAVSKGVVTINNESSKLGINMVLKSLDRFSQIEVFAAFREDWVAAIETVGKAVIDSYDDPEKKDNATKNIGVIVDRAKRRRDNIRGVVKNLLEQYKILDWGGKQVPLVVGGIEQQMALQYNLFHSYFYQLLHMQETNAEMDALNAQSLKNQKDQKLTSALASKVDEGVNDFLTLTCMQNQMLPRKEDWRREVVVPFDKEKYELVRSGICPAQITTTLPIEIRTRRTELEIRGIWKRAAIESGFLVFSTALTVATTMPMSGAAANLASRGVMALLGRYAPQYAGKVTMSFAVRWLAVYGVKNIISSFVGAAVFTIANTALMNIPTAFLENKNYFDLQLFKDGWFKEACMGGVIFFFLPGLGYLSKGTVAGTNWMKRLLTKSKVSAVAAKNIENVSGVVYEGVTFTALPFAEKAVENWFHKKEDPIARDGWEVVSSFGSAGLFVLFSRSAHLLKFPPLRMQASAKAAPPVAGVAQ